MAAFAGLLHPAIAQTSSLAARVLVLVNDRMPDGNSVGQYYAQKRGIPPANVLHVQTSTEEYIVYSEYKAQIETPLRSLLDASGGAMRKQILYIVTTYGIPLKTSNNSQMLAVDSVISSMYAMPETTVRFANPYYSGLGGRPLRFDAWADQREAKGVWKLFIVSRLDGPSVLIAQGLVDKALAAEPALKLASGTGYFDYQGTRSPAEWQYAVDEDVRMGSILSKNKGFSTVLNTQASAACGAPIHPASYHFYDASAKNVFSGNWGAVGGVSFSFTPMSEGDVVIGIRPYVNNSGNFAYVTLGGADPNTYIKLTYPFVPFTQSDATDQIVLEKVVAGASVARTTVGVDRSAENVLNGVTEFRFDVQNGAVSAYRNGSLLATAADSSASQITLSTISLSALCLDYRITGLTVTDKSGKSLWSDTFATDTTANYTWNPAPLQGQNALWAWGWLSYPAFDSYRFVPGAVGAQLTSTTAITIRTPANPDPAVYSRGSERWGPNWVPRMLEEGITATWGTVDEPYADFYASGTNVFDHFWAGYNFGESFYLAEIAARWTMVAVGDPLYAPQVFQSAGKPSVTAVLNGASGERRSVAPGEIVAVFGQGIGPATVAPGQLRNGVLDRQLSGTEVLVDGTPAPLLYASSTQVGAIIPYEVAGESTARIQVWVNGVTSDPVFLDVAPAVPGLFTANQSGAGQGAILNQDYSTNSKDNPAGKGSAILLFGTGEGPTNPRGVEGTVTGSILSSLLVPTSVQIGGVNAEVLYAGEAPGLLAGVFQINVIVPASAPSGNAVPVTVRMGASSSQPGVTVAIR